MSGVLNITGRDVLFAHWPIHPDALRELVPSPLEIETYEGSAWIGVLALENTGFQPTGISIPHALQQTSPQLNLRTYVNLDGDSGVYFLSMDNGDRLAAEIGRQIFGLPFYHGEMRVTRRNDSDSVTFWSRRSDSNAPPARFGAQYEPSGPEFHAEHGSREEFLIERTRYFTPGAGGLDRMTDDNPVLGIGSISRDPWRLQSVDVTFHSNTLFTAIGLEAPSDDPIVHYSPVFEMTLENVGKRNSGSLSV